MIEKSVVEVKEDQWYTILRSKRLLDGLGLLVQSLDHYSGAPSRREPTP